MTVAIVEDHAMVAEGLAAALAEDGGIEVVGIASTAEQAAEMIHQQAPDVALVDFRLPDGDGAQLTAAIKRGQTRTQIILLTAADDHEVLAMAIEAGAAGFIHKSEPIEEVVRAVRAVQAGESWFRPDALAELVGTIRHPGRAVGDDLTAREREVLALLAQGASTQAMIETLVLSPHTVRNTRAQHHDEAGHTLQARSGDRGCPRRNRVPGPGPQSRRACRRAKALTWDQTPSRPATSIPALS